MRKNKLFKHILFTPTILLSPLFLSACAIKNPFTKKVEQPVETTNNKTEVEKTTSTKPTTTNNINENKNTNISENTINKNSLNKEILVGHWNVLNYGSSRTTSQSSKVYALSSIIQNSNFDLIGLTEINYNQADKVQLIIDELNKTNPEIKWNYVFQPVSEADLSNSSTNTKEQVAIVYKETVFQPNAFSNNKKGDSFAGEFKGINTQNALMYRRPLYGHNFKLVNTDKTFTFIFGHFDSPGVGSKEKSLSSRNFNYDGLDYSVKNSMGEQEALEAMELHDAMAYFDGIDGNSTILFGGDTNIKYENNDLFKKSEQAGYKLLYNDSKLTGSDKYATSLRSPRSADFVENDGYAEPYDKILFKEAEGVDVVSEKENPELMFKIDLINAFNKNYLNKEKYQELLKNENKNLNTNVKLIRSISDHVPVFAKIIIK
ncbi:endonuclease/exonuclease/phosphatase family protein [Mycoplasmopsis alligatoris]|uniref:Endonuclease/exonuclease/phosphatase family protein n=1 Tax=Mycoplasmopsis alligatoris A21JP2 TaxID=747682 RepID=D4XUZ4_9BACT|nr:endonuclease/exonuclease/phosphatase family protein [Mycoplasmopsis alligatoris]EFF41828.1 endonuclease/exonuclease/phosphatase family protein [Mycoplasmopsis alligatoris A21JP2]